MWQWFKRVIWSLFHPTQIRQMRRAWRIHMHEVQHYHLLKLDFKRTKRQSGPRTLNRKRKYIRESGQRVVKTCGPWIDYSTELPWNKI